MSHLKNNNWKPQWEPTPPDEAKILNDAIYAKYGYYPSPPIQWRQLRAPKLSIATMEQIAENLNQSTNPNIMQDQTTTTEFWAICELMGHQKIAGKLTEQVLGGASFIRVDVPELPDSPAFTRLLTDKAIYAINPVTEEVARHMAQQIRAQPIEAWDVRKLFERRMEQAGKNIGQGAEDADFDEDEDDDQPWHRD